MNLALAIGAGVVVLGAGALLRWRQPVLGAAARTVRYLGEVRAEVRKVTWPGWEELRKSTVVIIIFIIILGIVISVLDYIFSLLLVQLPARMFG